MDNQETFITDVELAKLTRTAVQTWRKKRLQGTGPTYHKIGRRVLYKRTDVDAWIDERARTSTADNR